MLAEGGALLRRLAMNTEATPDQDNPLPLLWYQFFGHTGAFAPPLTRKSHLISVARRGRVREVDMLTVVLRDLCEELGMHPHMARIRLRAWEIPKSPAGDYKWDVPSPKYDRAREALIRDPPKKSKNGSD
jgi:hypothetical protein